MINNNDKLSQLKKLSAIKADDSWVHATKYDLLSEIDSQNRMMKAQKLSSSEKVDMYVSKFLSGVVPTFNRVIAGFLIVTMGSGFSMAAQASVPGQVLWPVKRSIEKVELSLTNNSVRETEIHMKHINKRLDEIEKILRSKNESPEDLLKKERAIKKAISHLEKDIKSADISLKVVKAEKTASETINLAKKVKEKVKETTDNLKQKAESSDDYLIEEVIAKATESNEDVEDSVVNLAVEVHEELLMSGSLESKKVAETEVNSSGEIVEKKPALDPEKVDLEEVETVESIVKEMISEEIEKLEIGIKEVKNKYLINRQRVVDSSGEIIEQIPQKIDLEEVYEDVVGEVQELKSAEAEGKVGEAKALLEEGALKDAVEKITEGKEIQKQNEEELEIIEKEVEDAEKERAENSTQNTSSSDDIVVEDKEVENDIEASAIKQEEIILEKKLEEEQD